MTQRELAIVSLLSRYHELTDPVRAGKGNGTGGLLLMPHEPTCALLSKHGAGRDCNCVLRSVSELERLLALMRNQAKQQAFHGYALGKLRWHLVAYYVDAQTVGRWQPKQLKKGKKMKLTTQQQILRDQHGRWIPASYTTATHRDPHARRDRAELGVQWLEQHWRDTVPLGLVERDRVAA